VNFGGVRKLKFPSSLYFGPGPFAETGEVSSELTNVRSLYPLVDFPILYHGADRSFASKRLPKDVFPLRLSVDVICCSRVVLLTDLDLLRSTIFESRFGRKDRLDVVDVKVFVLDFVLDRDDINVYRLLLKLLDFFVLLGLSSGFGGFLLLAELLFDDCLLSLLGFRLLGGGGWGCRGFRFLGRWLLSRVGILLSTVLLLTTFKRVFKPLKERHAELLSPVQPLRIIQHTLLRERHLPILPRHEKCLGHQLRIHRVFENRGK
jgi:hypothetical protein